MPPPAAEAEGAWLDGIATAELDHSVEHQEQLQQQLTQWLTIADVNFSGFDVQSRQEGREAIILKVDIMQMAYDDPALAACFLTNPVYSQGLCAAIQGNARIQVPIMPSGVLDVQQLVMQRSSPQPVRLQGVCVSVATVSKQVYAQRLTCAFCGAEGDHLQGQPAACCAGRSQQPEACTEDLACRQYMPVQQIWVRSLMPDCANQYAVTASPVSVLLVEEDLCSSVNIGDIIDVVGQASLRYTGKPNAKLLADVQVVANNARVIQFVDLDMTASSVELNHSLQWHARMLLSDLCQAMRIALGHPLSEDLVLALLLSAASAGVPVSTPTQTSDAAIRNQVHVMVASEGHDPCLMRTLQEAASSLAGLHAWHSPALGPLLPDIVKLEKDAVEGDPQAVRVSGGSLANSNKGILLLDSVELRKAEKDVLGSALNRGVFELKQAPTLPVPATAAVWLLHTGDNAVKGTACSESLQQVTQRSAQLLGPSLFAAFDLVLPHSQGGAESYDADDYTDSILNRTACHGGHSHASRPGSQQMFEGSTKRQQASMMLQQRLTQSAGMPTPCITSEALMIMQSYYALLRQQHQAVGIDVPGMTPGTHTVATLMRMASASARLHTRQDVTTMPDAVLAIYLLQKSMKAKGCQVVEQLDMETGCGPCFSKTQGNASLPMMDRLKQIHNFLTDYIGDTAAEE